MTAAQEAELRDAIRQHTMAVYRHHRSQLRTSRLCACGCGQRIDTSGRRKQRRYVSYWHWRRTRSHHHPTPKEPDL